MEKMPDSEKTALVVGGAVAVVALLWWWLNQQQPVTDAAGNIVSPTAPGAPTYNFAAPPGLPNPTNPNTGVSNCSCGCTGDSNYVNGTLDNVTAAYATYLQSAEGQLLSQIVNSWEVNSYPGSLDVGESGTPYGDEYSVTVH